MVQTQTVTPHAVERNALPRDFDSVLLEDPPLKAIQLVYRQVKQIFNLMQGVFSPSCRILI